VTTETLPPIEWETPHPSVTNWVRSGIYEHLMSQMDKVLTEETTDEPV
jgi:hypothetical protein